MTDLTCPTCHFDGSLWSDDDVTQTLIRVDRLTDAVLDGAPDAVRAEAARLADFDVVVETDDRETRDTAVHAVMHRLYDLADRRRDGEAFEPMSGTVGALHASDGGVPKAAFPRVEVALGGIVGDTQNDRLHHGRPWQAVCLYSVERLAELRDEGHPIAAGYAGENITVSGLDWARLRGGLTISIGDVVLRTSMTVTPCYKIGAYFIDRNWNRIHHAKYPGWARWYASVVRGGVIDTGDLVTVTA